MLVALSLALSAVLIVSILMGLLLPAVQRAREAARRATCQSNLKQIMLAVAAYEGVHRTFPPIALVKTMTTPSNPFAHSLFARVLPELEGAAVYHGINFDLDPLFAPGLDANRTSMTTSVAAFLCPSDAAAAVPGYARCNYRACIGPAPQFSPTIALSRSGPFTVWRTYRPADFTDGLSETVAVSERLQGDWLKQQVKRGGDDLLGNIGYNNTRGPDDARAFCSTLTAPPATPHESRGGESWFFSGLHFTSYNHCDAPNAPRYDCSFDHYTEGFPVRFVHSGVFSASSVHDGGVNAGFMDGSVRFQPNTVALPVWRGLSTRGGGEIVP
jgi:prepilin-type processing-associated H-X9-DG protein